MGFGSFFKDFAGGLVNNTPFLGDMAQRGWLGPMNESAADHNKRRKERGLPPLAPEQITVANLFSNLSREQQKDLLLNNPSIETPLGSQLYDPTTNTISLTESDFTRDQRLRQQALAENLSNQLADSNLTSVDPSSIFNEGAELFAPEFEKQRKRLDQRLADQGIAQGSEAYNDELNRLEESQGIQLRQLARESVATTESQRAARFNEISSLLGTQQVGGVNFGQFQPGFSGLDLFGAEQASLNRAFQASQNSADRRAARNQAIMGALGQMGSAGIQAGAAAMMASDERLKKNIKHVGESPDGFKVVEFEYIDNTYGDGTFRGVIAQDIQDIIPDAVITDPDTGYKRVDYSKIDVNFEKVS